jgi:hypothetical protein
LTKNLYLKRFLERYTKEQVRKASGIKAIFFDVDGVLTDGKIIYDTTGRQMHCPIWALSESLFHPMFFLMFSTTRQLNYRWRKTLLFLI